MIGPAGQPVWSTVDVGTPAIPGNSSLLSCFQTGVVCPTLRLQSSALRTALPEQLTFVYQQLDGDGEVAARVQSMDGGGLEGAAGVSLRLSMTPGAPSASLWVTRSGRLHFESRQVAGGPLSRRTFALPQQSVWLKLERSGAVVYGFLSLDGSQWAALGSVTLPAALTATVGLVGGSQDPSIPLTALLTDFRVRRTATLPAGWSAADVGLPGTAGSTTFANGTFTVVNGSGAIGDVSDRFRFVYVRVSGSVELVARVASGGTAGRAEAGVMVRESLAGEAAHVTLALSKDNRQVVKRRVGAGLPGLQTLGGTRVAPLWLKIVKRGNLVTSFESTNGVTWTLVSSDVLTLPSVFFVGLSVAAGPGAVGQALLDGVAVRAVAANRPPEVALTAPLTGTRVTAGTSVLVSANATDPDDRVDAVEFYVNGRLIGVDTATPYRATWSSVVTGTHVITAVAVDSDGARVTSAPSTVLAGASTSTAPPVSSSTSSSTGLLGGSSTSSGPSVTPPPPIVIAPAPPTATVSNWRLVFSPSPDHDRTVDRYRLEVYALNPRRLVLGQDLGRPAVVAGDCTIDVSRPFSALTAGLYEAVVTAVDDATYLSSVGARASFTR